MGDKPRFARKSKQLILPGMSVSQIESEIVRLAPEELRKLRAWFAEFDMEQWDRQIEADSAAGKLDGMIERAMKDYRDGKATDL